MKNSELIETLASHTNDLGVVVVVGTIVVEAAALVVAVGTIVVEAAAQVAAVGTIVVEAAALVDVAVVTVVLCAGAGECLSNGCSFWG